MQDSQTIFLFCPRSYQTSKLMSQNLHPIADAQYWKLTFVNIWWRQWCPRVIDAGWSPGEDKAFKIQGTNPLPRGIVRQYLTIDLTFSHLPGDKPAILRAEVDNYHRIPLNLPPFPPLLCHHNPEASTTAYHYGILQSSLTEIGRLVNMSLAQQTELGIRVLQEGGVIAFPTDTVYGIGANPFDEQAVAKIYRIKQRPRHLALPLLLSDKSELEGVARAIPEVAWRLVEHFLPGGLTLILPKAPAVPHIVAPGDTVAVRIPNHPIPIALIRKLGTPLIGTSANLSGRPNPITAQGVREQLGDEVDFIINGGGCLAGIASTVVDVAEGTPRILREGAVPREEIEEVCGVRV
jgi:L-threonylcarbamoyladenylate synthase